MTSHAADEDAALVELLKALDDRGYQFVTPTPSTHRRVVRRPDKQRARDLRDVFGWSLPFDRADLEPRIFELLERAGAVQHREGLLKCRYRVSRVEGRLFLHSAFPTQAKDAVFLGPDSYRYASLIRQELVRPAEGMRIVDIGAGAAVGAIVAADICPSAQVLATDVNPKALRLSRINAAHAGHTLELVETSGLDGQPGPFDLVIANPPYILDASDQTYKSGGDMHGARISLDWSEAAMDRLNPGGRLVLYTGAAIVGGQDALRAALEAAAERRGFTLRYSEMDPDVFGGTLADEGYEDVERIAVVAAVATRPA